MVTVLHDLKKLLEDLGHVWVGDEVVQVESTGLLGHVLLVVLLVHGFLSGEVSELLDLVVVDHQGLSFNSGVVEVLLGTGGGVW